MIEEMLNKTLGILDREKVGNYLKELPLVDLVVGIVVCFVLAGCFSAAFPIANPTTIIPGSASIAQQQTTDQCWHVIAAKGTVSGKLIGASYLSIDGKDNLYVSPIPPII